MDFLLVPTTHNLPLTATIFACSVTSELALLAVVPLLCQLAQCWAVVIGVVEGTGQSWRKERAFSGLQLPVLWQGYQQADTPATLCNSGRLPSAV